MRNYTREITMEIVNKLILMLEEDYEIYEGTLLDNFIFYNDRGVTIGRAKPRKYIIVREFYKNSWSSGLEMIMTDDEKLVDHYKDLWYEEEE